MQAGVWAIYMGVEVQLVYKWLLDFWLEQAGCLLTHTYFAHWSSCTHWGVEVQAALGWRERAAPLAGSRWEGCRQQAEVLVGEMEEGSRAVIEVQKESCMSFEFEEEVLLVWWRLGLRWASCRRTGLEELG